MKQVRKYLLYVVLLGLLSSVPTSARQADTETSEKPKRWTVRLEFPEIEKNEISQELSPPPEAIREPEELGIIVYAKDDEFFSLELQRCAIQERSPIFSTKMEQLLLVPGKTSPVRFKQGQEFELYLRMLLDEDDPRSQFFPLRDPSLFSLVRFEVRKKDRKFSLVRSGLSFTERQAGTPLRIQTHGEHSFKMNLNFPLEPGEYSILYQPDGYNFSYDLFCFGIDP